MEDIKICTPTSKDFNNIYNLLKQLWPNNTLDEKKTKTSFLIGLNSEKQEYRMLLINNKIVGFASLTIKNSLWQEGNIAHIDELIVSKEFRGKGFGAKLLVILSQIAIECSCKKIELDSAFHRERAHKFYEKEGFKKRAVVFSKDILES
ncbi:MAG: GNAT family N-acetyltransferase [Promethearchaeota archaeon]